METYRKEYAELRQKYFKENKIKAEQDLELYCDWLEDIVVNKNCNLQNVSQQRELLQTFKNYLHAKYEPLQFDDYDIDCFIEGLQ